MDEQLQSDPNILRMLNLGDFHMNSKHINISTELKLVQTRVIEFPDTVKLDLNRTIESKLVCDACTTDKIDFVINVPFFVCGDNSLLSSIKIFNNIWAICKTPLKQPYNELPMALQTQ